MIWIITGLVTAILCFIAFRIGFKDGLKKVPEKLNNLYNDGFNDGVSYERNFGKYYGAVDEEDANSIEAKIIELSKNNKVEPWTSEKMFFCYGPAGSFVSLFYHKRGLDEPDEDGYAVIYPDNLELSYNDMENDVIIQYLLKGDTVEEEAKRAARIISGITHNWENRDFWWSDTIDKDLPF